MVLSLWCVCLGHVLTGGVFLLCCIGVQETLCTAWELEGAGEVLIHAQDCCCTEPQLSHLPPLRLTQYPQI
jgi:hypothetical protein